MKKALSYQVLAWCKWWGKYHEHLIKKMNEKKGNFTFFTLTWSISWLETIKLISGVCGDVSDCFSFSFVYRHDCSFHFLKKKLLRFHFSLQLIRDHSLRNWYKNVYILYFDDKYVTLFFLPFGAWEITLSLSQICFFL